MPEARPLQPCPTCLPRLCCSDDPFAYSLVNGPVYENDQVAINFECPPGFTCIAGTYVIPAGRIKFIPTNGSTLRLQCCQSEIVRPVPAGSTAAQIGVIAQAMVNACALQAAECAGEATVNRSQGFNFRNTPQCANTCPPPKLLGYTTPPVLDGNVTLVEGRLCIGGSQFFGPTQANANSRAQQYLLNRISTYLADGRLLCGYWNTVQICPGEPPVIIEPFTFFSVTSQEEADQLALDSCVLCGSAAVVHIIDYADAMFDNPGQNGVLVGTFQFTNVQSPFLGSSWYTGHVLPNDLGTWTAMQNASAVTAAGNVTRLGNLEGGPGPGGVPYSQCGFGGCNNAETIFDQIGQTLSFYSGATTRPGVFTNPWDGQIVMTGGVGECAAYTTPQCVGIAGQLAVTVVITDANPHVLTVAAGATIIWEGSSVDLLGPYTRTSGTSAVPADLTLEVIS